MYRSPPPTHHKSEYDQYPMHETNFSPRPGDRGSPFADPYMDPPMQRNNFDHQPLLQQPASPYVGGSPRPVQFMPGSPNPRYGEAPRRQPRRYKTSKLSFSITWLVVVIITSVVNYDITILQPAKSSLPVATWFLIVLFPQDIYKLYLSRKAKNSHICDIQLQPVIQKISHLKDIHFVNSYWNETQNSSLC